MQTTYETTILSWGNHEAIEVPEKNLAELGSSRRAPVIVHIGDYSYKSTTATMDGHLLIPFATVHRQATGKHGGDKITVTLVLDDGYREVDMPPALTKVLKDHGLEDIFAKQNYSTRKEHARQVAEAKAEDTRERRLAKIISELKSK